MKITDVKVFPVDEDKLKAYATITFDNCFIVRDLKVISGNKGYFIAMPSKKRKDGTFRDVAHPLNSETRKMIEDAVLEVYEKENVPGSTPAARHDDDEGGAVDVSAEVTSDDAGAEEAADMDETKTEDESEGAGDTADEGETTEIVDDAEEPEKAEKGAEDNPVIEPSDDPEKAFGYEE